MIWDITQILGEKNQLPNVDFAKRASIFWFEKKEREREKKKESQKLAVF